MKKDETPPRHTEGILHFDPSLYHKLALIRTTFAHQKAGQLAALWTARVVTLAVAGSIHALIDRAAGEQHTQVRPFSLGPLRLELRHFDVGRSNVESVIARV